jgi:precorrin-2 dehydrogenase/sirohydrochlorin ferrochelatase
MHENNREDILSGELKFMTISLLSSKIHVLVVGGGKAGLLKTKAFAEKGCRVKVLSKEFSEGFSEAVNGIKNLELVKGEYSSDAILDKHIVVIAVGDVALASRIRKDCDHLKKLYLDCRSFESGTFVVPLQRETRSTIFNLSTKAGSPKTSQFLAEAVKDKLSEYDDFVDYLSKLRKALKGKKEKDEIMSFAAAEDFYFFYKKGYHQRVLNLFYEGVVL